MLIVIYTGIKISEKQISSGTVNEEVEECDWWKETHTIQWHHHRTWTSMHRESAHIKALVQVIVMTVFVEITIEFYVTV